MYYEFRNIIYWTYYFTHTVYILMRMRIISNAINCQSMLLSYHRINYAIGLLEHIQQYKLFSNLRMSLVQWENPDDDHEYSYLLDIALCPNMAVFVSPLCSWHPHCLIVSERFSHGFGSVSSNVHKKSMVHSHFP